MIDINPFTDAEYEVQRKVLFDDAFKGILLGGLPSLFLGSVFSIIYAIIDFILYMLTENRVFAFASLTASMIGFAYFLFSFSSSYENWIVSILNPP